MRLRREVIFALGLAATSGVFAAVGINGWMSSQFSKVLEQPSAVKMTTVVVAKSSLGLGSPLTQDKLVEAPWPVANVPPGSYETIAKFLKGQQQVRVALAPIEENEPILPSKVSGTGERFGLATMLESGKKAVTIRVNDVVGVGGFVLPGDRVDIFVTNDAKTAKKKDGEETGAYTDLLLQNMRVLAVDQTFDPKHDKPILGRTVTVEASLADAQRITLASTIGSLSLVLRESGSTAVAKQWKRLTVADLAGNSGDKTQSATFVPTNAVAPKGEAVAPVAHSERSDFVKVNVVRATASTEYSVIRSDASE
jgi:pilus assembly protein CpaB